MNPPQPSITHYLASRIRAAAGLQPPLPAAPNPPPPPPAPTRCLRTSTPASLGCPARPSESAVTLMRCTWLASRRAASWRCSRCCARWVLLQVAWPAVAGHLALPRAAFPLPCAPKTGPPRCASLPPPPTALQAAQAASGEAVLGAAPVWHPLSVKAFVGVSGAYDLEGLAEHLHRWGVAVRCGARQRCAGRPERVVRGRGVARRGTRGCAPGRDRSRPLAVQEAKGVCF
jgi:hypothetical protein